MERHHSMMLSSIQKRAFSDKRMILYFLNLLRDVFSVLKHSYDMCDTILESSTQRGGLYVGFISIGPFKKYQVEIRNHRQRWMGATRQN